MHGRRLSPIIRMASDNNITADLGSPLLTPGRGNRSAKTYQIDRMALKKYKRILQKRVFFSLVLIFLVIIERIFAGYFRADEDAMIVSLQEKFGIMSRSTNSFLFPVVFFENYLYFVLTITQYFIIIYYLYNALTCIKIMYVFFNMVAVVSIMEIIFGDPRPYWDSSRIIGVACTNSYGFPSFTLFCTLFLFIYSWHCFDEEEDDDEPHWTTGDKIKCAVFVILYGGYCFLKVLSGLDYLSQIGMTILYAILFYYLAILFDKNITSLVEKSSIDTNQAKRYTIFWMVFLLLFAGIVAIVYETSETFLNINWFSNYFNCLEEHQETSILKNTPYYHLIGAWGSYLRSVVLFLLLGASFGAAKAFRDFKGVLWYITDHADENAKSKKFRMVAIASLCTLPSWLIVTFQSEFMVFLQRGGIDEYLFNAVHFTVLYIFIFGYLPKSIFGRLKLLNTDVGFFYVGSEVIRMDDERNVNGSGGSN